MLKIAEYTEIIEITKRHGIIRVLEEKRKKKENLSLEGLLIYLTVSD